MPRKTKPDYAKQPSVAAILKLISRARGATAAEIAKARNYGDSAFNCSSSWHAPASAVSVRVRAA
jgi:hypothetical protein